MRKYCSLGKECKLKYQLDLAFITGELPVAIADQIGRSTYGLKDCMKFSDNPNDGYKPPKRPAPDNTPDNQMVLPFAWQEIAQEKKWELVL
ncbi:hypothetical protein H9Q13_13265 [Pontibacter sp. JH31]|uniref:Uncharacterized protein n=1 Tax=Pontibacter aquaedesilientis TaxID=2766980 RepID=A0ABR7XIR9_9BACT|nr:hypothetical protein [Pontibacter aquaedesilientis]MBD1398138.1 hypothetical protein [Pontibacter aquaedesilientis]